MATVAGHDHMVRTQVHWLWDKARCKEGLQVGWLGYVITGFRDMAARAYGHMVGSIGRGVIKHAAMNKTGRRHGGRITRCEANTTTMQHCFYGK